MADSDGISQSVLLGSAFSLTVPAGETVLLLANSLSAEDSVQIGWGQLQSPSGLLTGEATVRLVNWSNPANSSDSNDASRGSSRGSRRKSRQAESLGSSLCK